MGDESGRRNDGTRMRDFGGALLRHALMTIDKTILSLKPEDDQPPPTTLEMAYALESLRLQVVFVITALGVPPLEGRELVTKGPRHYQSERE